MAPGLDATVWYGQCDLKLSNRLKAPVQLRAEQSGPNELTIAVWGSKELAAEAAARQLRRREISHGRDLLVEVYLCSNRAETLVSRDRYLHR